jgi:FAD/FMN-containing dehydrogenase
MALARAPRGPIDERRLAALERKISGQIVRPTDPSYDALREVNNALIDRRPTAIVRPAHPADVAQTVALAAETDTDLAVRGGGHSLAGLGMADDALVLDMSAMKGLHLDPARRLAWAESGLTAGDYTTAAGAHGLATPFGDVGSVGIGGLTLGGGIGYLARNHGLAIDSLVSTDLVMADGRMVTASEHHNPDLFWAIRGGGGNFGVVTRFQFRLHEVDQVVGGALVLPATTEVVAGIARLASEAPDELTTISFVMHAPPMPFIPPERVGELVVMVTLVHSGDVDAGQAAVAPFRALAQPLADLVGPMPYPAMYELTAEGGTRGKRFHRSLYLDELDASTIDGILDRMATASSPRAMFQFRILGGAMARVPVDATAFGHRDRRYMAVIITPFDDDAEASAHEAWTHAFYEQLRPASTGVYVNFLEDEGEARIREAYPAGSYERLVAIKRRYDPTNLFRMNQNIAPFGTSSRG